MIAPSLHPREAERLAELDEFSILDTLPEEDYDNITRLASHICGTPISLISLIDKDRQWFKSRHGLAVNETPREHAFCAHAIHSTEPFVIEDSREDKRFFDNPLVTNDPHVIFYAGIPLVTEAGLPMGTLCVIDDKPHHLNDDQLSALKALARQVMNLLKLRKQQKELEEGLAEKKRINQQLEQFAHTAAHDIKSPLTVITGYAQFLKESKDSLSAKDTEEMLGNILESANDLKQLVNSLLAYSKDSSEYQNNKTIVSPNELMGKVERLLRTDESFELNIINEVPHFCVNTSAVEQVLLNLVGNAIKYNDKDKARIEVHFTEQGHHYEICVKDNGPGIEENRTEEIFEVFKTGSTHDKYGHRGHGIGLAIVKRLSRAMGGDVTLDNSPGQGCTFKVTLLKK